MQFPLSKLCVYEPQTSTLPIKVLLSPPPQEAAASFTSFYLPDAF